ncbi:hypothetical protein ACFL3S_07250 [Gemmatimonadota bacterium]
MAANHLGPQRGPRRVTGRRIPRPFDQWLISIFAPLDWVDTDDAEAPVWVRRVRKLAQEIECRVIFDTRRHWRESVCVYSAAEERRYILAGGAGKENYCCTALLHELGHALLRARHNHPSEDMPGEEEAWRLAAQIAQEERLPLVASIRRQGLYSYRRAELLRATAGSKQRTRRPPLPKTGKLTSSRRSGPVTVPPDAYPIGKKGRRKTKRDVKRATSKAERRKGKEDLRE